MQFSYKKQFLKQFEHLSRYEQDLVRQAEKQIRSYYVTHQAPHGLRVKLLNRSHHSKIYEARASDSLRILWAEQEESVALILVGSHDDVNHFLKNL